MAMNRDSHADDDPRGSGKALDLVIFDCDGVLIDSEPISLSCTIRAWGHLGVAIDLEAARSLFLGISGRSMLEDGRRRWGVEPPATFLADLRAEVLDRFRTELLPIADVAEVVAALPYRSCVASSSDLVRLRCSLEIAGLLDLFDGRIYSSEQVLRGKPFPDLFLFAAEQSSARPEHCLVVEDSPAGVRAARDAGMAVVGFTGGAHRRHDADGADLLDAGARLVFDRFAELPGILEQLC
jgi:HAD superfamily hydrolase (TIGR01509 family)